MRENFVMYLEAGYKIWEFDFVAKYGLAQNRKPSATQNNYSDESYAEPSGSNSYYGILQLSVIYNLGKKTNND